ncbi:hypothetical protein WS83_18910 [Burkholderia sp. MSMB2042]|nr:hypothetical protein WS78_09540 [Burkholderia savannae]KVG37910.1 hypothetical protein WS77_22240 [Burkholderia sp. MSMB0265]KVG78234.1 hypothetical protein WS81_16990 [Burkholderia sp. MSMB2040]KVG97524.1 hypothetical protein WS82_29315 [Burkholderia sp. MSMB2041]KVH01523.1 hypothetical protein WS83_18910 [Burkholderia sp. MSMB2042]
MGFLLFGRLLDCVADLHPNAIARSRRDTRRTKAQRASAGNHDRAKSLSRTRRRARAVQHGAPRRAFENAPAR